MPNSFYRFSISASSERSAVADNEVVKYVADFLVEFAELS